MRVLFLRRQRLGGIASLTDALVEPLEGLGIEVVVDDADEWIPNETGAKVDRGVSKLVKKAAQGFDLVHAFGYRPAWACAEAFYIRFPWVYTAYDMPKTTHTELIDRLNAAKAGFASSHAVRKVLEEADAFHVETATPGVSDPPALRDKAEARERLRLRQDEQVVLGFGRLVRERGFEELIEAMEETDGATLLLAGQGSDRDYLTRRITSLGPRGVMGHEGVDKEDLYAVADLVVVPSLRGGFSSVAAEAMRRQRPVMVRQTGGLPEMVVDGVSGFVFYRQDELGARMREALEAPVTLEAVGHAGKARGDERFDVDEHARFLAKAYRDIIA